jgi:hypothetical protein
MLYVQRKEVTALYRDSFHPAVDRTLLNVLDPAPSWVQYRRNVSTAKYGTFYVIVFRTAEPRFFLSSYAGTDNLHPYEQDAWNKNYSTKIVFITWSPCLIVCMGTKLGLVS